jgi:mannose-6-phosphate isomerase-like protein (cupin superfamily)
MIIDTNQITEVVRENAYGGAGRLLSRPMLSEEQWKGVITLCNRLRLEPGSEIGLHAHVDDFELYYIIQGTGTVNDDGEIKPVGPGSLVYTADGAQHNLVNTGDEILELLAIVLKD